MSQLQHEPHRIAGIEVDLVTEPEPRSVTRGSTVTLPLLVDVEADTPELYITSGETALVSDAETDGLYGISYGASYGAPPEVARHSALEVEDTGGLELEPTAGFELEPANSAYIDLLDYFVYAPSNAVRYGVTDRGQPWFRERIPPDGPDTLVVAVETPRETLQRPFWGLIVGPDDPDETPGPFDIRRIDIELFVLAPLAAYDDADAVRDDIGTEVV